MAYDPDCEIEQIMDIDPTLVQLAFRRGIIGGCVEYLDMLETRAVQEFEGKEELMIDTFYNLRKIIKENPNSIPFFK